VVLATVILSLLLFFAGMFTAKFRWILAALILFIIIETFFLEWVIYSLYPGVDLPGKYDVMEGGTNLVWLLKNKPSIFYLCIVPQLSFFVGLMIAQILQFSYRAGEHGVTLSNLIAGFRDAFRPAGMEAGLTEAEAL